MHDTAASDLLKKQRAILAIIVVSYLMIVVDISIVITGLPRIQDGLGFSHAGLSWVQNAYTLAFGGLLLLGAETLLLVLPMQFASSLARSISPITAVIVAVSGVANVNPVDVVKRTAIPMVVGLVATLVANFVLF